MFAKMNRASALILTLALSLELQTVSRADQIDAQPGASADGFGIWDQMDGRRLIGDSTLYEFRKTDGCLVIAFADPGGKNWQRWVVCHAPDGSLRIADQPNANRPRYATIDDSGVLTICYSYLTYDAELVSRFIIDGDQVALESGWMEKVRRFSRERNFHLNESEKLRPVTSELVEQASANLEYIVARSKEARQRREQREAEERAAGQQAAYDYLNGALAGATTQAQQSQADLDATLARIRAAESAAPRVAASPADIPASQSTRMNPSAVAQDGPPEPRAQPATASIRDLASSCISAPVVSAHKCDAKTGTKALITNTCTSPVDVRVCFMTDQGWNCQANYGVAPGRSWEPGWCNAVNSQVFHSERYSDSKEPLGNP